MSVFSSETIASSPLLSTAQQAMQDGPVTINRMGAEMQVQRMPEAEQLQQAREQADDSANLNLAEEVDHIKERLSSVEQAVAGGSTLGDVGKSVAQGSVGGLLGALAGSMISPGVGTVAGAAAGQEVAKGVAGDVSRTVTGQAYDKGSEVVSEKASQARDYVNNLDKLIEDKVERMLDRSEHGGQDIDGIR